MRLFSTIITVLLTTGILLSANKFLPNIQVPLHQDEFTNKLLKYQGMVLIIALIILIFTLKVSPESKSLLKFGNLEIKAVKEKWLGINGQSSWKKNGLQLAFFISLATGIFMVFAIKSTNSFSNFQLNFIPIVLMVALSNSFSEEIIYRFAINGNLMNQAPKTIILTVSAILFGIPHYIGFPSGIIGVIMAGILGYILSKATFETNGIGIAWGIHFLQDIIIFSALIMMNNKT